MTFPSFEQWVPSWGEDDDDFDADKAKKLIYNLSKDKAGAKTRLEAAKAEKKEVEDELAESKTALGAAQAVGNEKVVGDLQTKVTGLESELKAAKRTLLVQTVADEKGIPLAQAKRLQGETEDEIREDADSFLEAFPGKAKKDPDDEDLTADDAPLARTRPKATSTTGEPPKVKGPKEGAVNLDLVPRI